MYKQFFRLREFKVAQNFAVAIEVKKKSLKCLSTSRANCDGNSKKIPSLNFLRRTFSLPSDYFVRKSTGMEPCKFAGKFHVVKDEKDEQKLVQDGVVCRDFERQEALGMDLEYFNSPLQRICLIQLASKENAVLWTCNQGHFRDNLPPYLLSIIKGEVLKVGHDLAQDAVLVQKHYGECINNIVDTLTWAKEMNCDQLSLRAMCAIFLHQRLSKILQQSDWSKEDLSEKQLLYAATDAWASLRVYEEMKRTAELIGMPLSLPLKSTLDVFQLRQAVKADRNKRRRRRESERKKALAELRIAQKEGEISDNMA